MGGGKREAVKREKSEGSVGREEKRVKGVGWRGMNQSFTSTVQSSTIRRSRRLLLLGG